MALSVVIITLNEEKNIGRCLESVKWANEIIIVDALSRDRTIDIASKYTKKIFSRKWDNFFVQRSFALGLASCDFVLILDADEFLDKKAQNKIKDLLDSKRQCDGYRIMRHIYFLGRCLRFAEMPDPIMRLFKKDGGSVSARRGGRGHENYSAQGCINLLKGTIKHYTAHTISERLKKIDRYSTLWAQEQVEYGAKEISTFKMTYVMTKSFVGNFIIRGGILDGFPGLIWCILKAAENFLRYAKLNSYLMRCEDIEHLSGIPSNRR